MIIYLLIFSEWESDFVLGIFESIDKADLWKQYFIKNPTNIEYSCDMIQYSLKNGYAERFHIEERVVGELCKGLLPDNLKFLEFCEERAK